MMKIRLVEIELENKIKDTEEQQFEKDEKIYQLQSDLKKLTTETNK